MQPFPFRGLPVCNPTHTSLADVYKVIRYANVIGSWTRGLVVNRMGKKAEVPASEIERFMGRALGNMPILAEIPEDPKAQEAELQGVPVVVYEPDSPASVALNDLAKVIVGEADLPYVPQDKQAVAETTQRLVRALIGRNL